MEIINNKRKKSFKQDQVEQLQLEKVIGLSPPSAYTVSYNPAKDGVIAYSAGSVVVVYDIATKQHVRYLQSANSGKLINCTAFSRDGRLVAGGEKGHAPCVLVWDLETGRCVAQLKGHKYGVSSLSFSADGKLLVSSGVAYDGQLCIWDWQGGSSLCRHYAGAELHGVAFSEDASSVISVGKDHLKAWSISGGGASGRVRPTALQLQPRPVNLKDFKACTFVDVRHSPAGGFYAITSNGILVMMKPSLRGVDKSVNLQARVAYALATSSTYIATACNAGIVRLFSLRTLAFKANLPRIAPRGQDQSHSKAAAGQDIFPDAIACSFDASGKCLVVAYSDRSLHIWDVSDMSQTAVRVRSFSAHAGSIWDVVALASEVQLAASTAGSIAAPPGSALFATCSSDGSIRVWNLSDSALGRMSMVPGVEDSTMSIKGGRALAGMVYASSNDSKRVAKQPSKRWDPEASPLPTPGEPKAPAKEQQVLLRCVRLSPCGTQLAAGDQKGNLRVYDLSSMALLTFKEAHDAEILTLDYCRNAAGTILLASGSRDTLIHVYDAQRGYEVVQTLDEHTASVTAVRFSPGGNRLVSCSADRSIVFRASASPGPSYSSYHKEALPRSLLYDLAVDPAGKHVVSAGQDGHVRMWDLATGKLVRALQPEPSAGEPVRVTIDAGGLYAICANADGCSRVYDLASGALLCRAGGHGEMATAAVFSPDSQKLVSVSGDGCLCVWQLPAQITADSRAAAEKLMQEAAQQQRLLPAGAAALSVTPEPQKRAAWQTAADSPLVSTTALRIQQGMPLVSTEKLPRWAIQASKAAGQQGPLPAVLSDGGSSGEQAQQAWKPPADSRWAQQSPVPDGSGQAGASKVKDLSQRFNANATRAEPAAAAGPATQACHQPAQGQVTLSPLRQAAARAWADTLDDDDEIVYFSAAADDMGGMAFDVRDITEDLDLGMQREAQSAPAQEVPEADVLTPTISTEPSIEEPAVRRDLFRQHFDSLSDNKALQEAAGSAQPDQARQSMSSRFKAERASTCGPLHQGLRLQSQHSLQRLQQQAGGSILGAATAAAPAAPLPPAPAAPQRSTPPPPPAQEAAAATPPVQPAAASPFAATAAAPAELLGGNLSALTPGSPDDTNSPARVKRNRFIQPRAPQPMLYRSTSEPLLELAKPGRRDSDGSDNGEARVWRRGQMDDELQRMRNQLDNLHEQFRAQNKAKQHGSPHARKGMRSAPSSPVAGSPRVSDHGPEKERKASGAGANLPAGATSLRQAAAQAAAASLMPSRPSAAGGPSSGPPAGLPPLPPGPPPAWSMSKLPGSGPGPAAAPQAAQAAPAAAAAAQAAPAPKPAGMVAGPGLQLAPVNFSMTDSVLLGSPEPAFLGMAGAGAPGQAGQAGNQAAAGAAAQQVPSQQPSPAAAGAAATDDGITPAVSHRPGVNESWPAFDASAMGSAFSGTTPPSASPIGCYQHYEHQHHEPVFLNTSAYKTNPMFNMTPDTPLVGKTAWGQQDRAPQQQQQQQGANWVSNAAAGSATGSALSSVEQQAAQGMRPLTASPPAAATTTVPQQQAAAPAAASPTMDASPPAAQQPSKPLLQLRPKSNSSPADFDDAMQLQAASGQPSSGGKHKPPGSPSSGMMGLLQRMKATMAGKKKSNKYAAAAEAEAAARAAGRTLSSEAGGHEASYVSAMTGRTTSGSEMYDAAGMSRMATNDSEYHDAELNSRRPSMIGAEAAQAKAPVTMAPASPASAAASPAVVSPASDTPAASAASPGIDAASAAAPEDVVLDMAASSLPDSRQAGQPAASSPSRAPANERTPVSDAAPAAEAESPAVQDAFATPQSKAVAAQAAGGSPAQPALPRSMEDYTAALQRFRGMVSEMQQMWTELSSSATGTDAQQEQAGAVATAAAAPEEAAERCASPAVAGLRQRFQQEVMRSITDLNASVAGSLRRVNTGTATDDAAGLSRAPSQAAGATYSALYQQQQQQQSIHPPSYWSSQPGAGPSTSPLLHPGLPFLRSPTTSMASEASVQSSAFEEVAERICQQYTDILSKKLEDRLLDRLAAKLQGQALAGGSQGQAGGIKAAGTQAGAPGQLQSRRGTQQ